MNIRSIIYSYFNLNMLILKISKLSKQDRNVLITSRIICQQIPIENFDVEFTSGELERSLAYVIKLASSLPQLYKCSLANSMEYLKVHNYMMDVCPQKIPDFELHVKIDLRDISHLKTLKKSRGQSFGTDIKKLRIIRINDMVKSTSFFRNYNKTLKTLTQDFLSHVLNIEELTIENLNQGTKFDFGYLLVSHRLQFNKLKKLHLIETNSLRYKIGFLLFKDQIKNIEELRISSRNSVLFCIKYFENF